MDNPNYIARGIPRLSQDFVDLLEKTNPNPWGLFMLDTLHSENSAIGSIVQSRLTQWANYLKTESEDKHGQYDPKPETTGRVLYEMSKSVRKEGVLGAAMALDALVMTSEIIEQHKREYTPSGLLVVPDKIANYLIQLYKERKNNSNQLIRKLEQRDCVAYAIVKNMADLFNRERKDFNPFDNLIACSLGSARFFYSMLIAQLEDDKFKESNKN